MEVAGCDRGAILIESEKMRCKTIEVWMHDLIRGRTLTHNQSSVQGILFEHPCVLDIVVLSLHSVNQSALFCIKGIQISMQCGPDPFVLKTSNCSSKLTVTLLLDGLRLYPLY